MSYKNRWSKAIDWPVYMPGDISVKVPKHSRHFLLEKQMEALSRYHDGLVTAVEDIMDAKNEKEAWNIAMKFKEDFYDWSSFGTFYTGGANMLKLYLELNSHTWSGYQINGHWKRFRTLIEEIWDYLPIIYRANGQDDINERYHKDTNPFGRYQRPHDLDEHYKVIVEKSEFPRWSRKFDENTNLQDLLKDWDTLSDAIGSLEEYARELSAEMHLEFTAEKLYSTDGYTELYIEPPADYFGSEIRNNIVYYNIHNTLYKLTQEGYDIRSYWQIYKNAMNSIFQDTKKMYIREWVAACNDLVRNSDIEDPLSEIKELRKLKREKWLPESYDPDDPYPSYPIPEDID